MYLPPNEISQEREDILNTTSLIFLVQAVILFARRVLVMVVRRAYNFL